MDTNHERARYQGRVRRTSTVLTAQMRKMHENAVGKYTNFSLSVVAMEIVSGRTGASAMTRASAETTRTRAALVRANHANKTNVATTKIAISVRTDSLAKWTVGGTNERKKNACVCSMKMPDWRL